MNKEMLIRAKDYIAKMAQGINPLTNEQVGEDDTLNNIKISRCLFFVKDVLEQNIRNDTIKIKKTLPFFLSENELKNFVYATEPTNLSDIVKRINNLVTIEEMQNLRFSDVQGWLVSLNILYEEIINDKKYKRPTTKGLEIGINTETRTNFQGVSYRVNVYNRMAQEFIIDNFDYLLEFIKLNKK